MRYTKAENNNRGSIILMVIGLLTILAMLGTTLLLIARMDQRTSRAAAGAAPARDVANSVLGQLRADRFQDLHISGGVAYGNIANPEMAIDYPYEDANPAFDADAALANIEPIDPAAAIKKWRHLSHLRIIANTDYLGGANFIGIDALPSDNNLVDTDGDGTNDARLFNTTIQDREGKLFQAAVRMIDAGGLMNINTANTTRGATGNVMDASDVSLEYLLNDAGILAAIINERAIGAGGPFDFSDLMDMVSYPSTPPTTGRAYNILGAALFASHRSHLTTYSKSTLACPAYGGFATPGGKKVNLNSGNRDDIYNAFRAMLNAANWSGPVNAFADQLTANVLSFRESSDTPQRGPLGAFGIERQPFITKIFCRLQRDNGDPANDSLMRQWSAIEFFNPYDVGIPLDAYRLEYNDGTVLGGAGSFAGKNIPANGRFVVYSPDNTVRINFNIQNDQKLCLPSLNFHHASLPLRLIRQVAGLGDVCIDSVPFEFDPVHPQGANGAHSWYTWFRDEVADHAKYTVAQYEQRASNNPADETFNYYTGEGTLELGVPRQPPAVVTAGSCPIYVRNGLFVNVGELMRILTVGPTSTLSVPDQLAAQTNVDSWSSGRLDPNGSILNVAAVRVPPACLIGEYFTVYTSTPIDGLVNINTAPRKVLECLPAIAQLAVADDRTRVVNEIMAYRDYITYGSGPTGSSDYGTDSRAKVTKIEPPLVTPRELRSDRNLDLGFATSGEIAIPIRQALPLAVGGYPGAAPGNYAVSMVGDDGFNTGGGYPTGDLDKFNVHYKWLSNQVTVRSDTYIAYILVRPGGATGSSQDRRFVALIDRSECTAAGELPKVLMMAEVK